MPDKFWEFVAEHSTVFIVLASIIVGIAVIVIIAFLVIHIVAFYQGREITLGPIKIGVRPVAKVEEPVIPVSEASKIEDKTLTIAEPSKTWLFGYFFIEENGIESKILKFGNSIDTCLMSGKATGNTIEESIDAIVQKTIKTHNITPKKLLKAGFSRPIYHRLFKGNQAGIMKPTPYIFFKIGLRKNPGINCQWVQKKGIFPTLEQPSERFPLKGPDAMDIGDIFRKDFITKQLDFTILECVDVLIFRRNAEQQIEFLLGYLVKGDIEFGWEYPKGGMLYHETYLEAVYREVEEETAIRQEDLQFCSYLGFQTVDVTERQKLYKTLRVHGVTLYYTGDPDPKKFKSREGHTKFQWFSLEDAPSNVWMKEDNYAANFFDLWKKNEEEILHKVQILEEKRKENFT